MNPHTTDAKEALPAAIEALFRQIARRNDPRSSKPRQVFHLFTTLYAVGWLSRTQINTELEKRAIKRKSHDAFRKFIESANSLCEVFFSGPGRDLDFVIHVQHVKQRGYSLSCREKSGDEYVLRAPQLPKADFPTLMDRGADFRTERADIRVE